MLNQFSKYPLLQSPARAAGVLISICPVGIRLNLKTLAFCNVAAGKALNEDRFAGIARNIIVATAGRVTSCLSAKKCFVRNLTVGQNPIRQNLTDFDP